MLSQIYISLREAVLSVCVETLGVAVVSTRCEARSLVEERRTRLKAEPADEYIQLIRVYQQCFQCQKQRKSGSDAAVHKNLKRLC